MPPIALAKAQIGPALTLVVIERHGSEFEAVEIKTSQDVQRFLVDAWETTLLEMDEATKVAYSPEIIIRPDEGRVLEITGDLRAESDVVPLLLDPRDLGRRKPRDVDAEALYLYAVVSTTDAGRLTMIKKLSPAKRAREGKAWALAQDELRLMENDPWQLHPRFDMVVGDRGAYALSVNGFEQLFADAERLVEKVDDWVRHISNVLPMDDAQRSILAERCRESSRLRRRLRSIENRGHIPRVTVARVRTHLKAMGIPVNRHVRGGKLVVDRASAEELLHVLNEDLFRGALTDERFRTEAKEPLR